MVVMNHEMKQANRKSPRLLQDVHTDVETPISMMHDLQHATLSFSSYSYGHHPLKMQILMPVLLAPVDFSSSTQLDQPS